MRPPAPSVAKPLPPPRKPIIGSTLGDRYRIEKLLGEGGMGAVYQAEHILMRKRMAIKVLHPEMTRLPEVVARFEREAMAAAHIDHPHVVTATDFGKLEDGSFFLALEYVEGKSLRDVVAQGRLDLGRGLHIARQIAAALSRAHQLKIVHRDLKPENVMLVTRDNDPDFVKVLDFGIAKVQIGELTAGDVNKAEPGQALLTQAGMVYGTPEYMAPEQALGQPVDPRADLYALGVMLYEMITGVRPFDAESKVALLGMQVTMPVPPMANKAPDANVPPEVEAFVLRLLAKEASERTPDAREVIDGILALQGLLVAAGRIDQAYAPPPGAARPATNPALISGISPAIDVPRPGSVADQTGNRPLVDGSSPRLLETLGGSKSWLVAAGGGLVGILVLVLTVLVVLRESPKAETEAGVALVTDAGEIGEPGVDDRVKDAIGQIDKGNYGSGIDALTSLGAEADAREDVHRALIKAYTATNRPLLAMREIGAVVKANPNVDLVAPEGVTLRVEVRDTALQEGLPGADKAAVDEAFTLLNGRLGTVGEDDLYDIAYGKSGVNYTKARDRARSDIAKGDRAKMAPALAIAADLRNAGPSCNVRPLLDRASAAGDERALDILRPLVAPRMTSGHWRKTDSLGCIHDGSLTKTIADIDAHVRKH